MKKIIVAIFALSLLGSCDKDDSNNVKSDAVLTWTGDYAVDGCGFFVTINDQEYKPENEDVIDNSFKSGSTNVILEYQLSNKKIERTCGDLPTSVTNDGIKIISITKK